MRCFAAVLVALILASAASAQEVVTKKIPLRSLRPSLAMQVLEKTTVRIDEYAGGTSVELPLLQTLVAIRPDDKSDALIVRGTPVAIERVAQMVRLMDGERIQVSPPKHVGAFTLHVSKRSGFDRGWSHAHQFLLKLSVVRRRVAEDGTAEEEIVATGLAVTVAGKAAAVRLDAGTTAFTAEVLPQWNDSAKAVTLLAELRETDSRGMVGRMERVYQPGEEHWITGVTDAADDAVRAAVHRGEAPARAGAHVAYYLTVRPTIIDHRAKPLEE